MKTIIYTGIALFSAASVYGLTDYYSSSKNGTLNSLYKEKDPQEQSYNALNMAPFISGKYSSFANQQNEITKIDKENAEKELKKNGPLKFDRRINLEDFSRGRIVPHMCNEEIVQSDSTTTPIMSEEKITKDSTNNQ